jgi:predicted ATP-dependent serine protease
MIKLTSGTNFMENIKPLEWIWEPLIPRNCISILASRGGVGKSGFSLWLANKLSGEGKKVLYVDAERCGYHIKQRIKDWNLDNWEKIIFSVSDLPDGSIQTAAPDSLSELTILIKNSSPDLVILDSLTIFARALDGNKRENIANYFEQLTRTAVEFSTGILILAHTKKKQDQSEQLTLDSIAGSGAISDLARSVLMLDFAGENGERILTQQKINLTSKCEPLSFTITSDGIMNVHFIKKERLTGTLIEKYRMIALELMQQGVSSIKEIRAALVKEGAAPAQYGKAIEWATQKLNIETK